MASSVLARGAIGLGLLAKAVERVSDHPVLFIFCRSLLENDFKAIRALIRRELRLGQRLRTLDLGCGPGAFADLFEGDDYVGADLNRRYIDHARRHRKGTFIVGDARRVDLPSARFDQVLIFGLLHHLPDEDARAVLGETRRLLAPGGRALVIEDIPAVSRLNLVGRLIHSVENGEHIRSVEHYRRLYSESARIEREEVLRSGICDYYAAVLVS
jgi:SAM-dependent methyltransferase